MALAKKVFLISTRHKVKLPPQNVRPLFWWFFDIKRFRDVNHISFSLIVVGNVFLRKETCETRQKCIHKIITDILSKNFVAWHSDENQKKATSKKSSQPKITHMVF